MGGGGFGMQSTYAGTGGGFNYSAPNGQWGTKRINAEESLSTRSSDVGQEKRESFSHSTQLSQMYHLLDSYHLGTNRVVFFIQPRPHTLEEPSYFVKGPRPVEGIQEFFAIIAQPKEQQDFCVSLRLDTSHMTKTPIMDYERKVEYSDTALANATLPTKQDTYVERKVRWHVDYGLFTDDIYYKHYVKTVTDDVVYPVPDGFNIESYSAIVDNRENGFATINLSPDGRTITIHAEANSSIWFRDEGPGGCVDNCPPKTLDEKTGRVEIKLQVNLISTERTKQIDEEESLMITTRGLCCCPGDIVVPMDEYVVGIKTIPKYLRPVESLIKSLKTFNAFSVSQKTPEMTKENHIIEDESSKESLEKEKQFARKYTIRQANELNNYIKIETIKSFNDPNVKLQKFLDTDFFARQLAFKLIQFENGRELLNESVVKEIPNNVLQKLEKYFKKDSKEITRRDMLSMRTEELTKILGMKTEDVHRIKLLSLGVKFHGDKRDIKSKKGKKEEASAQKE